MLINDELFQVIHLFRTFEQKLEQFIDFGLCGTIYFGQITIILQFYAAHDHDSRRLKSKSL